MSLWSLQEAKKYTDKEVKTVMDSIDAHLAETAPHAVAENIKASNQIEVTSTNDATSVTSAPLKSAGGLAVAKNALIGDSLFYSTSLKSREYVKRGFTLNHSNANPLVLNFTAHQLTGGESRAILINLDLTRNKATGGAPLFAKYQCCIHGITIWGSLIQRKISGDDFTITLSDATKGSFKLTIVKPKGYFMSAMVEAIQSYTHQGQPMSVY